MNFLGFVSVMEALGGWPKEKIVGGHGDKGPSSTSSEGIPSRVDTTRVITWLRPVGEHRANAFWKKFSFPSNVRVSFPPLGPSFANSTEED